MLIKHRFSVFHSVGRYSLKEGTTYNHLKPPTTIYNHLEKFNNHLQPPQKHLPIFQYANISRKWNSRSEHNLNLHLESYFPRSPCIINHRSKSRNEIRDHSFYILYSRSSKDL